MLAWEKIIVWVISLVVLFIIIFFLIQQLQPGGSGVAGDFFGGIRDMSGG